ncbi:Uncharacterized protein LOCC1_G002271 [Lachnellula occidentalis]|uniref:SUN domain-containing protein n=1 Tax=Lachnellula occidentalis TaxID=215460 RepID=A0A8H8RZM8_9HELO|nr:Uncharacterized protein LOCC1_G002271 [Lachnellula occidentalis]
MLFVYDRDRLPAAAIATVLLLFSFAPRPISSSSITPAPQATPPPANLSAATCEFRTINYITDSLPQLCFRSSWSSANSSSSTKSSENTAVASEASESFPVSASPGVGKETVVGNATSNESVLSGRPSATESIASVALETPALPADDLEPSELNEASFLSFEEWKKQALEKAGQANANIGNKKLGSGENKKRDLESIQNNLDSVGDEGEIDLDFNSFRDGESSQKTSQTAETTGAETREEPQEVEKTAKHNDHYRSKDAGITCKERFSYASFDAGATVLKTHSGAKNPKAILIEDKDSYMISECSAENKFIIIELSEDIWIDTIVLANYEFFSSMVRTFRVSVSDRYPVKMEKWKDAGTYEARNSRDIQAFLIENPQIWARYLRIEFLSHYGNEYYCPLSLVRVHGTRMLESWKESEAIGEDEDTEENEDNTVEEHFVPDAVAEVVQEEERVNAELRAQAEKLVKDAHDLARDNKTAAKDVSKEQMTTSWVQLSFPLLPDNALWERDICRPSDAPVEQSITTEETKPQPAVSASSSQPSEVPGSVPPHGVSSPMSPSSSTTSPPGGVAANEISTIQGTQSMPAVVSNSTFITTYSNTSQSMTAASSITSHPAKVQNMTATHKNKTTTTSSASTSLPTIQESFFKAASRRLQLLETNSTLSLKYIEEQSKILREAFSKVEKKQLQKSTSFLDTLNSTVFAELRGFRQQYDEIWQSTVISLESQREESRREILAISSRLNILADEVVFQKRMSIVQSVLLLLCLGLVIFSRVSAGGIPEFPNMHVRARNLSDYPVESPLQSPPESPEFNQDGSWVEPDHRRQRFGASGISRSRSRDNSPPTPVSTYSRSDFGLTPPSGPDDATTGLLDHSSEHLEPPLHSRSKTRTRSSNFEASSSVLPSHSPDSVIRSKPSTYEGSWGSPLPSLSVQNSPVGTPKKYNGFIHQLGSPSASGADESQDTTPYTEYWVAGEEQIGLTDGPTRLPSPLEDSTPPPSIARKPLPALPKNGQ